MANVLVIDDDEDLRIAIEQFLKRFGHIVTLAANGREGVRLLRQKTADLVITDIFMPEFDGLEVILEVRKLCRELFRSIPIIAISGGMSMGSMTPLCFLRQAKAFGADRVFPKPLDFTGMCVAVQELLLHCADTPANCGPQAAL